MLRSIDVDHQPAIDQFDFRDVRNHDFFWRLDFNFAVDRTVRKNRLNLLADDGVDCDAPPLSFCCGNDDVSTFREDLIAGRFQRDRYGDFASGDIFFPLLLEAGTNDDRQLVIRNTDPNGINGGENNPI